MHAPPAGPRRRPAVERSPRKLPGRSTANTPTIAGAGRRAHRNTFILFNCQRAPPAAEPRVTARPGGPAALKIHYILAPQSVYVKRDVIPGPDAMVPS